MTESSMWFHMACTLGPGETMCPTIDRLWLVGMIDDEILFSMHQRIYEAPLWEVDQHLFPPGDRDSRVRFCLEQQRICREQELAK